MECHHPIHTCVHLCVARVLPIVVLEVIIHRQLKRMAEACIVVTGGDGNFAVSYYAVCVMKPKWRLAKMWCRVVKRGVYTHPTEISRE